jgi:hypothetical protein
MIGRPHTENNMVVCYLHFIPIKKIMNRKRIIAGISLLALAGVILYLRRRHRANIVDELKAEQVSEHGYETAHDILFPKKNRRIKRHRYNQGWR